MNNQPPRALVTGGAGFIGGQLVDALLATGYAVTSVDLVPPHSRTILPNHSQDEPNTSTRLVHEVLDITRPDFGEWIASRTFDVVFHLAANAYIPPSIERPLWDFSTNVVATVRLLEALRHAPQPPALLYASSAGVYGNPARLPMSESDIAAPISPYGAGKLAAERYVAVYAQVYGLRTASLRFFSCYGPGQRKQVVYDLFQKVLCGSSTVTVLGDGTQTRDLVYVTDVVSSCLAVHQRGPMRGETYNVGTGTETTIHALLELIAAVVGTSVRPVYTEQLRPGDAQRWRADVTRLTEIGWRPGVSLVDGLTATYRWLRHEERTEGGCHAHTHHVPSVR